MQPFCFSLWVLFFIHLKFDNIIGITTLFCLTNHLVFVYFIPTFQLVLYTWNPNDPRFDWERPSFGGFKAQNRGQTGCYGTYIYICIFFFRIINFGTIFVRYQGLVVFPHPCLKTLGSRFYPSPSYVDVSTFLSFVAWFQWLFLITRKAHRFFPRHQTLLSIW